MYKVRFERFQTKEAAHSRASELSALGVIGTFFIVNPRISTPPMNQLIDPGEGIVQTARRYIGVPYAWGGASTREGFDCSGLTMTVYRLNGMELPHSAYDQFLAGRAISREELKQGDLVFFASGRGKHISHVGIYSGQGQFIHAPGRGKHIRFSSLSNSYFKVRYKGARRYYP